jgi:hypothetical protein
MRHVHDEFAKSRPIDADSRALQSTQLLPMQATLRMSALCWTAIPSSPISQPPQSRPRDERSPLNRYGLGVKAALSQET